MEKINRKETKQTINKQTNNKTRVRWRTPARCSIFCWFVIVEGRLIEQGQLALLSDGSSISASSTHSFIQIKYEEARKEQLNEKKKICGEE